MAHSLGPGSCCVLTLLTNADLKADITLFVSKKYCLFNILTRVGAHASHGSKIKALVELLDILCTHNPLMHAHAHTLHLHPMPACMPIHAHTYQRERTRICPVHTHLSLSILGMARGHTCNRCSPHWQITSPHSHPSYSSVLLALFTLIKRLGLANTRFPWDTLYAYNELGRYV